VTFTVQNTGNLAGDEVAQIYYRHVHSAVPQPRLALCGFSRVHLNPGETGEVTISIPAERLRYRDPQNHKYVVEPGDYELLIGSASDDLPATLPLTISPP